MTIPNLPDPIVAYFVADQGDGSAVARCFTAGAIVRDEGKTHAGHAAIQAWKTETSTQYSYVTEPHTVEEKDGGYVVTSRVIGNFPGSPIDLHFAFRLESGKIAFLEITP